MQSLQDAGKPTSRRDPPTARHASLEVGGFAEMQVVPKGSLRAAGAHDQADRDAGNHPVQVGTSGRGEVSPKHRVSLAVQVQGECTTTSVSGTLRTCLSV